MATSERQDLTASDAARMVRDGTRSAASLAEDALARIADRDAAYGAFERIHHDAARRDAAAVDRLGPDERAWLPLAGVPVAIKDNVPVAGQPMRIGSRAVSARPSPSDHPVVTRLRGAGAVVVGTTRLPELGLWGTSDNAFGIARSPWSPDRTAGGSSGGSAAAVAAAMVPVAHGNDGLGSIRIPAACCGLVGLKPGPGLVPSQLGATSWFGIAENGALATTVADLALVTAAMAGDMDLSMIEVPDRPLRIGLAVEPPVAGLHADEHVAARTREVAQLLASLGHEVEAVRPPAPGLVASLAVLGTWTGGARGEFELLAGGDPQAWAALEHRTRSHIRVGGAAVRLRLTSERHRLAWREKMDRFLERFDVLMTPTLARPPLAAGPWRSRSWIANLASNILVAPYCGPVNFARLPAIAFPSGIHPDGTPCSAHLVGRAGSERLLLGLAAQVEAGRPWPRFSPRISGSARDVTGATRGGAEAG